MYNNDYIIAVDENGSPYIAHAYATDNKGKNTARGVNNAVAGFRTRAHQYLQKVKTKTGKWRYLYTPEEVAALGRRAAKRAWGSKAGRFIDEHDAGASERLMANYYRNKAKKATNEKDREKYLARAMSLYREGKDEGTAARERLRSITTRKKKK